MTYQYKAHIDWASAITFKDSGGSAELTLQNLTLGTGQVSASYDRGAGAQPQRYRCVSVIQWEDHPAATNFAEVYVVDHDNTLVPGDLGVANAAVTVAAKLLQKPGSPLMVSAEAAAGSINRIASKDVFIFDRYISVAVWDASATKNLKNTANVSYVILAPIIELSVLV